MDSPLSQLLPISAQHPLFTNLAEIEKTMKTHIPKDRQGNFKQTPITEIDNMAIHIVCVLLTGWGKRLNDVFGILHDHESVASWAFEWPTEARTHRESVELRLGEIDAILLWNEHLTTLYKKLDDIQVYMGDVMKWLDEQSQDAIKEHLINDIDEVLNLDVVDLHEPVLIPFHVERIKAELMWRTSVDGLDDEY